MHDAVLLCFQGKMLVCNRPACCCRVLGQRRPLCFAYSEPVHARPPMTQGSRAFLTVGLPLFALTLSGFYGLSHLVQGKYDVQVYDRGDTVTLLCPYNILWGCVLRAKQCA